MLSYRGLPEQPANILCCFDNFVLCFDNFVLCFDNFLLGFDNFVLCFDNFGLCFTNIDLSVKNIALRFENCLPRLCLQYGPRYFCHLSQAAQAKYVALIQLTNAEKTLSGKRTQSARSAVFWGDRFAVFERDSKKYWVNKVNASK